MKINLAVNIQILLLSAIMEVEFVQSFAYRFHGLDKDCFLKKLLILVKSINKIFANNSDNSSAMSQQRF